MSETGMLVIGWLRAVFRLAIRYALQKYLPHLTAMNMTVKYNLSEYAVCFDHVSNQKSSIFV